MTQRIVVAGESPLSTPPVDNTVHVWPARMRKGRSSSAPKRMVKKVPHQQSHCISTGCAWNAAAGSHLEIVEPGLGAVPSRLCTTGSPATRPPARGAAVHPAVKPPSDAPPPFSYRAKLRNRARNSGKPMFPKGNRPYPHLLWITLCMRPGRGCAGPVPMDFRPRWTKNRHTLNPH